MNFEQPQKQEKSKYKTFGEEIFEDKELIEKAKRQAMFYLRECKIENLSEDLIAMVHFFNNPEIIQSGVLKNNSNFFDINLEYLEKMGYNTEEIIKNSNPEDKYLVAIPSDYLDTWTNTKSWIKLSKANVLDYAAFFLVPKNDVILREHKHLEMIMNHRNDESLMVEDAFKYYESTIGIKDDLPNFEMPEAWIPHPVSLENAKIITFKENNV